MAQDVTGIRTMVLPSLLEAVSDLPEQSNEKPSLRVVGHGRPIVDEFSECGWLREKQHGRSDLCATRRWCCREWYGAGCYGARWLRKKQYGAGSLF